jgi:hypothetical protein
MEEIISQRFKRERDLFFEDPVNYLEASESSILHLLRRDIYRCMGYTIESNKNIMWIKDNKINAIIWSRSGTWSSLETKTPLISKTTTDVYKPELS